MWWGLWTGLVVGIWLGAYNHERLMGSPISGTLWLVITGACVLVACVPDAIGQIAMGIRRYRTASR
jgi:hypothetical protein